MEALEALGLLSFSLELGGGGRLDMDRLLQNYIHFLTFKEV
jgi:hypothetical protein